MCIYTYLGESKAKEATNLGEGGWTGGHEDLTHTVVEAAHGLLVHAQETLSGSLFRHLQNTETRQFQTMNSWKLKYIKNHLPNTKTH